MPVRTSPPVIATREVASKMAAKRAEARTLQIFRNVLIGVLLLHAAITVAVAGVEGYLGSWGALWRLLQDLPIVGLVVPVSLVLLYRGIDMWRNPAIGEIRLPEFPPIPDLRQTDDIYVGSAWTRNGKQPGDVFDPENDELFADRPHVVLKEAGLFGNLHVKGGVGGGKTSTFILPFVHQAIGKYPKPVHPDTLQLGPDGRYPGDEPAGRMRSLADRLRRLGREVEPPRDPADEGPIPARPFAPYGGMTRDEALAEYERRLDEHKRRKWGVFVIDPKGDMTEVIERMAAAAGRSEDVVVLRPDGDRTYNPLLISANPLVQSEMVMDGIEAVAGQAIQQYWRQTMSEWLANALAILRVADPTRITFRNLLRFARLDSIRTTMVQEAEAAMREAQAEEERARRMGQEWHGQRVNPAAIEFFNAWDDPDNDPKQKQAVVSGIQAQAKFFVDDELAPFLCPEMPPTFAGFDALFDEGQIVVLRMPLGKYSQVAKVLGILVLADAQQAARDRINKPWMNQERAVAFVIDEIASYLNKLTKEFLSINRQSRVTFTASHQSQGQLVQQGDRGFETSFNDNLRTKISYSAPNAESARRESALFGARLIFRESWSQSTSFSNVRPIGEDDGSFAPGGPQSEGASVRIDDTVRPWFAEEDFLSLSVGELIISEFDGITTLTPRKIKAPAYYKSESARRANALDLDLTPKRPHPLVCVRDPQQHPSSRDHDYVPLALETTGYAVIIPLADADGNLAGQKIVTDVGTLILSTDVCAQLQEVLTSRLGDPQTLIVLAEPVGCTLHLQGELGVQLDRVLEILDLDRRLLPTERRARDLHRLVELRLGAQLNAPQIGAWEWHNNPGNRRAAVADSRRIMTLFTQLGHHLDAVPDATLDRWHEETREHLDAILRAGGPIDPPEPDDDDDDMPPTGGGDGAGPGGGGAAEAPADGERDEPAGAPEDWVDEAELPEPVARLAPPEVLAEEEDPLDLYGPGTVDQTENPWGDAPELPVPEAHLPRSTDPALPNRLRRSAAPAAEATTAETTTEAVTNDARSITEAPETDDAHDDARDLDGDLRRLTGVDVDSGAGGSGDSQPRRPARRRNGGSARRTARPRTDGGRLDLGFDEDGPSAPASRTPGARPPHHGTDVVSGAPLD